MQAGLGAQAGVTCEGAFLMPVLVQQAGAVQIQCVAAFAAGH